MMNARASMLFGLGLVGCGQPAASQPSDTDPDPTADTEAANEVSSGGDGSTGGDTTAADDPEGGESSTGTPPPMIDCTEACADPRSDVGAAVCYACRCKAAMDGWLPSRDELQCENAEPIVIYHADVSGPEPELVPATDDAMKCANPSLLTDSCGVGSRLGQIEHDDVFVKWICRDFDASTGIYDDVGAIAYNLRTGATCWWDDVDYVTGQNDLPAIDLLEADADDLARHLEVFYYTEGDHCTSCHDNDPFIYTPYLQSQAWPASLHVAGRYSLVRADGSLSPTPNMHLVTAESKPCATCHRMSSAASCGYLAADSMGLYKSLFSYEPAVIDAAQAGSAYWKLAYWMPNDPVPPITTHAQWLGAYEAARDHVMQCCENPGVQSATCTWEPIPG